MTSQFQKLLVSDQLERAAAADENLENSFYEIEFNGICVNCSKVVGTVLGNSNSVNVESSKVGDVSQKHQMTGKQKKNLFLIATNAHN